MATDNLSSQLQTIGLELQTLARASLAALAERNEAALEAIAARREPLIENIRLLARTNAPAVSACPALIEAGRLETEFLQQACIRRDEIMAESGSMQNRSALLQLYGPNSESSDME